ncbi:MAG: hypothetical protein HXX13_10400 [Bacteroidetes bacterium]|nr:hypothetical protein [Bacteroidota bacterium]
MTEEQPIPEGTRFIAKTIAGLEEVLAQELTSLGGTGVEILNRAVGFYGDKRLLYKSNYCSRTALRILSPLFSFQMADEDDLYTNLFEYPWEELMGVTQTLAIDSVVSDSELTHSHYVALRSKDAVVDRFREKFNGRRPSVDIDDPDFRINIHIFGNVCDVSLDSSGTSLHKRGYRVSNAEAPMSEVLAAGLILLSGWNKKSHFIDPMCGSGTLLIEAALIANNFPPGLYRKSFGFMRWKDFDQQIWDEVIAEAEDQQTEFEFQIIGNDIAAKNLAAARVNVKSARLHKDIHLQVGPFSEMARPEGEPGMIIINPPYGERIRTNDIIGLYKEIGDTLKKNFSGYKAWVISSDQYALKSVGLKASRKDIIWNGPLECRFAGFDLYEGTRKQKEWVDYDLKKGSSEKSESGEADETASGEVEGQEKGDGIISETLGKEGPAYGNRAERSNDRPTRRDNLEDRPYRRERKDEGTDRPFKRESRSSKPFHKEGPVDRPFSRERKDDRGDRPFKRDDRTDKPFRKSDSGDRPFNRERKDDRTDRPFKRDDRTDRPFRKSDSGDRPFNRERKDDRTDRPFKRDDRTDRPFRKSDSDDRPFSRDKKDDRTERPFKRDERTDRPFRKSDSGDRPFSRDKKDDRSDRPFKRDDRTDRPFRKSDSSDRPFSRDKKDDRTDRPFKRDDRTDKPFYKKDSSDRPYSRFNKDEGGERPARRSDHSDRPSGADKKESKPIEVYQPQNRFEKPEKAFRREDGKVNEGDPSGSRLKPKKPGRPRKPRNDED